MLHIARHRYIPDPFEVPAGEEVVIMSFLDPGEDASDAVHSVTSAPVEGHADKALFHVTNIQPTGEPYFFTAPAVPGTYPYYCIYHGDAQGNGMAGTLVALEPAAAATPTPTTPTSESGEQGAPLPALVAIAALGLAVALRRRS